jgi:hypothetical protein
MHTTATCSAAVALLGALVVLRWLPGRRPAPVTSPEHDALAGAAH